MSVCLEICYQPTLIAWFNLVCSTIWSIFTARHYAKCSTYGRRVSVRPSVWVCLSHFGIVYKRLNVGSRK